MHPPLSSPTRLLPLWKTWSRVPFGKWCFAKVLGIVVPYSGSIGAAIVRFEPGYCVVRVRDKRRICNHLGSVHAAALMNLAELASGLAFHSALPPNMRGIVTQFDMRYQKKARGVLTAESSYQMSIPSCEAEYKVSASVKNVAGEVVCEGLATWRVQPISSTV